MTAEISNNPITKIGRYRITGELGRGGMGIVYQGEDRLIGRRVAIKTLTEVTPELRERFYLEAKSGILSHPNIVTVYELGEHEESPFIAMEFIEGDSLEKLLRAQKRLSLLEALSIVEQICAGLGYAHGHGVVHRDVKPANILVRPDGRVTIVDFGIARLADQTKQLTKTDTLLGTFHYIAPERLKGEASDGKADIWSLGVMLYEMLTGELPFKGRDVSALYRVIHEPYVPLAEHIQDMPDDLSRVLDKALAKQLDARYATAEEMAFDLHVLAQGLKHDRVGSLLETARRLTEQSQFASARTVLLQAQRIDPVNGDTKSLLSDVQDRLSHLHRGEQLRQHIEQVQDAESGRRWSDAVVLLLQAQKLDTENTFNLDERLQIAKDERSQQQRVLELWKQADDARHFGDLTGARDYLGQALQIDGRNTELQNAYSDLQRELKRHQQQRRFDELLQTAREENGRQRCTEAISLLREAAEIDPVHPEVQDLLISATARQTEGTRQKGLDTTDSNSQNPLGSKDSDSAGNHETRLLETLPADGLPHQLTSEVEDKKRRVDIEQEVTALVSNLGLVQNANDGADPTKLLKIPQQPHDQAQGESDLTLQFSEALLKAQLGEAPSVRQELRAEQDKPVANAMEEIQTAINVAVTACDEAMAARNFDHCLHLLDDLEKQYPGNSLVAAARMTCESKRGQKVKQLLQEAIQMAQQQLAQNSAKRAEETLREVEGALPYVTLDVRNDWKRLNVKCETSLRAKSPAPVSNVPVKGGKVRLYAMVFAMASALIVVGAISYRRYETPAQPDPVAVSESASTPTAPTAPTAPVASSTDMEINVSPWAKVVSVQDKSGKNIVLPEGDTTTPLRLEAVASGIYEVTFAGPDNKQHTVECRVSPNEHLCSVDIGSPSLKHALTGEKS
ncbi:serine/threonine protein kinase [Edaphobacter modestus]|uniref:non-specific serine/threonine protein kinase n=2 Tax=Edaphobacter modestus TaxID=388466 RepID=A0A4Q7YWF6_9BACT|nr:serine/threonine protein kinase [Edaphobacter modestus]